MGWLTRRSLFRVSLAGLLFIMACVAGFFSGFRYGQVEKSQQHYLETEIAVDYEIADLVVGDSPKETQEAIASLTELITSTVSSEMWEQQGGPYSAVGQTEEVPPHWPVQPLTISASGAVHDEIANLMGQLRRLAGEIKGEDIIPQLQSIVSSHDPNHCQIIRAYQKKYRSGEDPLPRHFSSAVKTVTDLWGEPSFSGECTEKGFPRWSSAHRIATWPKNGGIAFVELRDMKVVLETQGTDCQCLATGWRPNEEHENLVVKYHWDGPLPK